MRACGQPYRWIAKRNTLLAKLSQCIWNRRKGIQAHARRKPIRCYFGNSPRISRGYAQHEVWREINQEILTVFHYYSHDRPENTGPNRSEEHTSELQSLRH